jgi:hypothetical protein
LTCQWRSEARPELAIAMFLRREEN